MDECDPGALLANQACSDRYPDYSHASFAHSFECKSFLMIMRIVGNLTMVWTSASGIPMFTSVRLLRNHMKPPRDIGKPDWNLLFGFILARMSHLRFLSTVYVLVDNRDLTNLDNPDPSLQHWPAAAAWWSSRACMQGPASELCDVVFFPISDASGLRLVHHTWATHMAGTFVLAALCLVFPGLNIVLLDSDCVPVTLFEVEGPYGRKHYASSIVGSLVRFQPAVGLGA